MAVNRHIAPPPDRAEHWQGIYRSQADDAFSWFEPLPRLSLELIRGLSTEPAAKVIDVGGGSSTLVDELLAEKFVVTVFDISETALDRAKARLGDSAAEVQWVLGDVVKVEHLGQFDIWHDRATFHFLTDPDDRRRYLDLANRSVVVGGHLILATFALNGPRSCSGLPVERYDAQRLSGELGEEFQLLESLPSEHRTPSGVIQSFVYALFRRR